MQWLNQSLFLLGNVYYKMGSLVSNIIQALSRGLRTLFRGSCLEFFGEKNWVTNTKW